MNCALAHLSSVWAALLASHFQVVMRRPPPPPGLCAARLEFPVGRVHLSM